MLYFVHGLVDSESMYEIKKDLDNVINRPNKNRPAGTGRSRYI